MMNGKKLLEKLNANIWHIIRAVFTANRDYPYHDFETIADEEEPVYYKVGKNNVNIQGDQTKFFVSKATAIFSDVECTIRLNHTQNTPITIRANTAYNFESNITGVYVTAIGAGGYLDMIFEGVLPQETRDAH